MQFSHYVIAALAAMSMIGAAAGADDTATSHHASVVTPSDAAATATTTSSSRMRMTVEDGVPATAPRKLTKQSKAATNACAVLSQNVKRLLRTLVFEKAMELYRSVQQQPSSDDAARADDNDERAVQQVGHHGRQYHRKLAPAVNIPDGETMNDLYELGVGLFDVAEWTAYQCELCLNFQWDLQDTSVNTQKVFCQNILKMVDPDYYSDDEKDSMMNDCTELFQCQSQGTTRLECCQSQNHCLWTQPPDCSAEEQGDPYYCKLNCYSGSCENYWFQAETKAECDTASTARSCGGCKDKGTSNDILQKASMPVRTDGFVSLCAGGLVGRVPDCVDRRLC